MTTSQSKIQWPAGKTYLNVKEAAELLESVCPSAPLAKDNDSDLRRELIKADRVVEFRQKIRRAEQEHRIRLIHITLGLPVVGPDDCDEDVLIEQREFENFAKEAGLHISDEGITAACGGVAPIGVRTEAQTGTRTNKAEAAERACEEWLKDLQQRPKNKDAAFEATVTIVAPIGPLSRKAFENAWRNVVPAEWKTAGARKGAPRSRRQ